MTIKLQKKDIIGSGSDSIHNSFNQCAIVTDINCRVTDINCIRRIIIRPDKFSAKDSDLPNRIWFDTSTMSAFDPTEQRDDFVVHHDPIRESDCEEPAKADTIDDIATTAAKKSAIIEVRKGSSECIDVTEAPMEDVIYKVVDKTEKTNSIFEKDRSEDLDTHDDGIYSVVMKSSKEAVRRNAADDVGNNVDDGDDDDNNDVKTVYAHVGDKIMIINDDGDYASVKSLSDPDLSKTAEITGSSGISLEPEIPEKGNERLVVSSETKPQFEDDSSRTQSHYAVQYLGSMPITQEQLAPQSCNLAISQCIIRFSLQAGQNLASRVEYEWQKDAKMIMEVSKSKHTLKLLNAVSKVTYTEHFLHSIRMWAVGKEVNSKYFAYVIRNGSQKRFCRVFLCEIAASHVASAIGNICRQLATLEKKKLPEAKSTSNGDSSLANPTKTNDMTSLNNKASGAISAETTNERESLLMTCHYLGVVQVKSPQGKETVSAATEKVYAKMPKEMWKPVDLQLSPSAIIIKDISNSRGSCKSLSVDTVTYVGSSTQNKKLAAILVQNSNKTFQAHVFHHEPTAKELVQEIKTTCQLVFGVNEHKQKNGKQDNQKQKGLRGVLFGKLMDK